MVGIISLDPHTERERENVHASLSNIIINMGKAKAEKYILNKHQQMKMKIYNTPGALPQHQTTSMPNIMLLSLQFPEIPDPTV